MTSAQLMAAAALALLPQNVVYAAVSVPIAGMTSTAWTQTAGELRVRYTGRPDELVMEYDFSDPDGVLRYRLPSNRTAVLLTPREPIYVQE